MVRYDIRSMEPILSAGTIKKVALEAGLQTLRMDGARKVVAGVTAIAEVLRVTQADVI